MCKVERVDPEDWAPEKTTRHYMDTNGTRTISKKAVVDDGDGNITEGNALVPDEEDGEWTLTVAAHGDAKRAHIKRMAA